VTTPNLFGGPPGSTPVEDDHRLALIHPFVNGNGRHTRLVTNKLLSILDEPEFTWARDSLQDEKELRRAYIYLHYKLPTRRMTTKSYCLLLKAPSSINYFALVLEVLGVHAIDPHRN